MTGLLALPLRRFYIGVVNQEPIALRRPDAERDPSFDRGVAGDPEHAGRIAELAALAQMEKPPESEAPSVWRNRSIRDMIGRLEHEHHQILRSIIFHSAMLLHDAASIDRGGATAAVRHAFREFSDELIMHIEKEEHLFFPALLNLETARERGEPSPLPPGEIRKNIDSCVLQHAAIGCRLFELRKECEGLELIDREMAQRLLKDRYDLECHVHASLNLENYVLFPRAIALEDDLQSTPPHLSAART